MENQHKSTHKTAQSLEEIQERERVQQKARQIHKEREERKKKEEEQEKKQKKHFDWCFSNMTTVIHQQKQILELQRNLEKRQAIMLTKASEKMDKCLKNFENFNKNQGKIQETTAALLQNHKALSQLQHDVFKQEVGAYERLKLIEQYVITDIASSE